MRDLCNRIVLAAADFWTWLGWLLFCVGFLGGVVLLVPGHEWFAWVLLAVDLLLLLWWVIDVVDQEVPAWMLALGVAMLAIGCLPGGSFVGLAAFVLYMTRVRQGDDASGY